MANPAQHNPDADRRQQGVEGDWICVGAFAGSHGVRGEVKLRSFTENPLAILDFDTLHRGADGPVVSVKKTKTIKGGFGVRVDGVHNREDAQALNGVQLYVPRSVLAAEADEDEFYLADLIGLEAVDVDANLIGHVKSVENFGADDLLEIVLPKAVKGLGRFALVPFTVEWVPVVDIDGGRLVVAFDEWLETQVEVPTEGLEEASE